MPLGVLDEAFRMRSITDAVMGQEHFDRVEATID